MARLLNWMIFFTARAVVVAVGRATCRGNNRSGCRGRDKRRARIGAACLVRGFLRSSAILALMRSGI